MMTDSFDIDIDIDIDVDRDSVAMGDDVLSHHRRISVSVGTLLSAVLAEAAPEIRARGWSWVAEVDGHPAAVWSVDHGVRILVRDVPVTRGNAPRQIFFRYFVQIDPEWLYRRLVDGAEANRYVLEREYRPIGDRLREEEERRREKELPGRLLGVECSAALRGLGVDFDLHNDRLARFGVAGSTWRVRRMDTMTVTDHGRNRFLSSIRPAAVAEVWLAAAVGQRVREVRGLPRTPDHLLSQPDLYPMSRGVAGEPRWTTRGHPTVQLTGDDAVNAYRLSMGRTIGEIMQILTGR
ncbi:hypothetical protein SAMN04488548_134507 [Gordonia westfalica]|uniref:Uncharacterized protein n=2 Tax=Gordonia westfalica TaxID=158898 RepID=A0A1H2HKJ7_9ACTN|nr:hypothetical protein SAMN04488548_134507 [Gordonia westfalica]